MKILIFIGFCIFLLNEKCIASKLEEKAKDDDKLVLLEIDLKEPVKRSPITTSNVYGGAQNQFIIRHGDDAQELSPEYLALIEQYTQAQPQAYDAPAKHENEQPRQLLAYARQQPQQAYHRPRLPVARPHLALHQQVQAEAQHEVQPQPQLHASEASQREYQSPVAYAEPKRGTFEHELLQLVSANQAQEFGLIHEQKKPQKQYAYPQYAQQILASVSDYTKSSNALPQNSPDHQQYHIETSAPRYQPQPEAAYVYEHRPKIVKPQPTQPPPQPQYQQPRQYVTPSHYNNPNIHQVGDHQESEAIAQAQAQAEAQALAFQKISQASHLKHQQAALEQIRIVNERHRQQTALEQINQGRVSEAGKEHIEEQVRPKNPEAKYRARLKAQIAAETAEARKHQEAAEYKAHADAILALQRQQQAHLQAQEDAYNFALNFEKNQQKAQEEAQALANAQAEALYKAHQSARLKAQKEAVLAARAQEDARKRDPEHTPVIQYLLPSGTPLPEPSLVTSQVQQKYYADAESAPKAQLKLLKKKPYKPVLIDESADQEHVRGPQLIKIAGVSDYRGQQPAAVRNPGPGRYYGKKDTALDRSGYVIYDNPWLYQNAEAKQ
ncbi:chromatin modification-related protein eaf-1-like [Chelonus insularis]|uniref:chromatin modification-related protein eaf-1-like n=1 Tax=Chelonus insularis TaxID=460826 RepID=UPI00158A911E|nr:chromatin modification-related protein eaf-1-like [Chelonus insularis]